MNMQSKSIGTITSRLVAAAGLMMIALALVGPTVMRSEAQALDAMSNIERYTFTDLAEKVLPSVVTVYVERDLKEQMSSEEQEQFRRFFEDPRFRNMIPGLPFGGEEDEPFITRSSGSGVIISEDGYVVTNQHVVGNPEDGNAISLVLHDDTEIDPEDVELIWSHSLGDLAVLKIKREGLDLPALNWGDSDTVRIGERVAAIGSPLDLRQTITQGIISAKHREIGNGLADLIQTDAVINPGSSGGALVNMDGQLIGINRLITTNNGRWQGYGFAIPSNDARRFAEEVIETGRVAYGYIGISMRDLSSFNEAMYQGLGLEPDTKGVVVMDTTTGAPAEKAGIEPMDIIVAIDDVAIEDGSDLLGYIARQPIGEKVRMEVLRTDEDGELERKVFKSVRITERPSDSALEEMMRGGSYRTPEEQEQEQGIRELGIEVKPAEGEGLEVEQVAPGSPAARAGLQPGDILMQVNNQKLKKTDDLLKALEGWPEDRPHLVRFVREGRSFLITLEQSE